MWKVRTTKKKKKKKKKDNDGGKKKSTFPLLAKLRQFPHNHTFYAESIDFTFCERCLCG